MSQKLDFINSLMSNVTSEIVSGNSILKDELIANQLRELVKAEAQKYIPNAVEKASKSVFGSIHDPESGWTFEALTGNNVAAVNSLGSPIMDAGLYKKIRYPKTDEERALSQKVMAQDKDWTESLYSNEYLGKYQQQKADQIRHMFTGNNPMKDAIISGLPVSVVTKMNPLAAAEITSRDFLTLQVNNNLVDTLGMVAITDSIFNLFQNVSAPNLVAKYWNFGDIDVEKNVPEGEIIETTKTDMEETKFKIGKNAGGVSATWESQLVITSGTDPYGIITNKIAQKLAQARNEMKATTIETLTPVAGADWAAVAAGISTNDPADSFLGPILTITDPLTGTGRLDNPGDRLVIISGAKAAMKFNTNTFTKGTISPEGRLVLNRQTPSGQQLFPMPITWMTSSLVSATKAWIINPRAVPNFLGPNQRSEWFDQRNLSKATYYFDAVGDAVVDSGSGREITGVVT